jgi:hypothetical protein
VRRRAEAGRCQTLSEVSLILIFHIVLVHYVVVVIIRTTSWCRLVVPFVVFVLVVIFSVLDVDALSTPVLLVLTVLALCSTYWCRPLCM